MPQGRFGSQQRECISNKECPMTQAKNPGSKSDKAQTKQEQEEDEINQTSVHTKVPEDISQMESSSASASSANQSKKRAQTKEQTEQQPTSRSDIVGWGIDKLPEK